MLARICPSLKTCATEHISILILFHTLPPFLLSVFPFCPLAYVSQNDPSKSMSMFRTFMTLMSNSILQVCLSPQGLMPRRGLVFTRGYQLPVLASSRYAPGPLMLGRWDRPLPLLPSGWQGTDLKGYYFLALAPIRGLPASLLAGGMGVSQHRK